MNLLNETPIEWENIHLLFSAFAIVLLLAPIYFVQKEERPTEGEMLVAGFVKIASRRKATREEVFL